MSEFRSRDGAIARRWWSELADAKRGDRGALAKLRRCQSPVDAFSIVPAIDLARRLRRTASGDRFKDVLGLAVVLAHVRTDAAKPLMRAAGWASFPGERKESESPERPVLSELRFRRLIQTTPDEKVDAFRRLVRILHAEVNVEDLAESFLCWGDGVRQRWAFEYFAAGQSAPPPPQSAEGTEP